MPYPFIKSLIWDGLNLIKADVSVLSPKTFVFHFFIDRDTTKNIIKIVVYITDREPAIIKNNLIYLPKPREIIAATIANSSGIRNSSKLSFLILLNIYF